MIWADRGLADETDPASLSPSPEVALALTSWGFDRYV
jgi:hypothetical protein